jgi:hypothetical protein
VLGFWTFLRAVFFGSTAVALENAALRHQLLVLQRSVRRSTFLASPEVVHGDSGRRPPKAGANPRPAPRVGESRRSG